jgi:hypothetical protein
MYTPDVWVVLELNAPQLEKPIQKVFAGWYGGFAGSNSWQLNSGIKTVRKVDECLEFDGYSGSVYRCHPNNYHMSSLMQGVLANWLKQSDEQNVQIRILELDEIKLSPAEAMLLIP